MSVEEIEIDDSITLSNGKHISTRLDKEASEKLAQLLTDVAGTRHHKFFKLRDGESATIIIDLKNQETGMKVITCTNKKTGKLQQDKRYKLSLWNCASDKEQLWTLSKRDMFNAVHAIKEYDTRKLLVTSNNGEYTFSR